MSKNLGWRVVGLLVMFLSAYSSNGANVDVIEQDEANEPVSGESVQTGKVTTDKKVRKCFHCMGKGIVTINTKAKCDNCAGSGVKVSAVSLKNKAWAGERDGSYSSIPRKMSKSVKSCQKCNRSGKMNVKKDVKCPKCKGSGLLKNGLPYGIADKNVSCDFQSKDKSTLSLAERILLKSKGEVVSEDGFGRARFNLQGNDGRLTFKCKDIEFVTRWSIFDADSVCAYKNDDGYLIGFKNGQTEMPPDKSTFESFDWTMRRIRLRKGDVLACMDSKGNFLCIRILGITRDGEELDDCMEVEFKLY